MLNAVTRSGQQKCLQQKKTGENDDQSVIGCHGSCVSLSPACVKWLKGTRRTVSGFVIIVLALMSVPPKMS